MLNCDPYWPAAQARNATIDEGGISNGSAKNLRCVRDAVQRPSERPEEVRMRNHGNVSIFAQVIQEPPDLGVPPTTSTSMVYLKRNIIVPRLCSRRAPAWGFAGSLGALDD